ncbi:hypothetical protein TUBRATIS_003980 [Tubulinosema ratisbonensis]|uniref:Uncharacterized protein n=1 Tax=Tubulinosema ratisbonensis TaxID=291195 RepID=A0A437APQ5_9MICR|nr:hypothetical protein TUBRATIS_003980 [Tubulinosema ratisbonensis]
MTKLITFLDENIDLEKELKNDFSLKPIYLNERRNKGFTEIYLSNTNENGILCAVTNEDKDNLLDCFKEKEKKIEQKEEIPIKKKSEKKSVQGNLSSFFIKKGK